MIEFPLTYHDKLVDRDPASGEKTRDWFEFTDRTFRPCLRLKFVVITTITSLPPGLPGRLGGGPRALARSARAIPAPVFDSIYTSI